MTRLRCGVIGLGVGEQHLVGFAKAGVEIAAVCDFNSKKLEIARSKFPNCKLYSSAEALIDDDTIDIVSIASFDDHHATHVLRSLSNGKHVFVEKPLCLSEEDLEKIWSELSFRPNLKISTNTILRMSDRFRDVRSRIVAGELGRLYYLDADYNYGRIEKVMNGWRGKIRDYSVILGGGIHVVDLLIWFVQSPVAEVSAVGNKFCSSGSEFKTPDMVVAWLRFKNGVIGKVSANFGCVTPHFHKLAVYGTQATFENRSDSGILINSRVLGAPPLSLGSMYPGVSKGDLIPSFVDEIRGCGKSMVSAEDMFNTMSACLAIDRSLRSGRPENVELYEGKHL